MPALSYKRAMAKRKLTFLITAGPTVEDIDPVRFLSNRSTGRMGFALAKAALQSGHRVILISGPTDLVPPRRCHFVPVRSARDMQQSVLRFFPQADITIKAAAVADYRPLKTHSKKIKKKAETLTLRLIKNPDILKILGKRKKKHQVLVGFAAETNDLVKNALKKVRDKNLDWIAVNNVGRSDIGFATESNELTFLSKDGSILPFVKQSKDALAKKMIRLLITIRNQNQ